LTYTILHVKFNEQHIVTGGGAGKAG